MQLEDFVVLGALLKGERGVEQGRSGRRTAVAAGRTARRAVVAAAGGASALQFAADGGKRLFARNAVGGKPVRLLEAVNGFFGQRTEIAGDGAGIIAQRFEVLLERAHGFGLRALLEQGRRSGRRRGAVRGAAV